MSAETRLLDSERRSMEVRVSSQMESEQQVLLASQRRKMEERVDKIIQEEQAALMAQRQVSMQLWQLLYCRV